MEMREEISVSPHQCSTSVSGRQPAAPEEQARLRWFLVFTKPSDERTAETNLERQGFHVYYPRLLRPSLCRGRWLDRIVSLFPRYLFIQLDAARQSLAPVRSTSGVVSLVRFGTEPKAVPDSVVNGLIGRADPQSGLHRLSCRPPLTPGTRVNIIAGALEGLDGIFEREAGDERVVVLLKLLGQDAPVRIPSRYVVQSVA